MNVSNSQSSQMYHVVMKFLSSWKFNIAMMLVNVLILSGYWLVISHQKLRDAPFDIDMILDSNIVP